MLRTFLHCQKQEKKGSHQPSASPGGSSGRRGVEATSRQKVQRSEGTKQARVVHKCEAVFMKHLEIVTRSCHNREEQKDQ